VNPKISNEEIAQRKKEWSSWILSAPAFIWLVVFFLIPYLIILLYSFFKTGIYEVDHQLTVNAYKEVFSIHYLKSFYISLRLALYTTIICILLGYPAAYYVARASERLKNTLLMLIIIPFWTNLVIRIFSWRIFLAPDGLLNSFFTLINIPGVRLLRTDAAVLLVMVYVYLPYMILPLYATIEKIDFSLLDAAMDLGAKPLTAFLKVVLPLSKQGILAGTILVFIPALGAYVIPQLVGNQQSLFIGQIITYKVKNIPRDWPLASALALFLLIIIIILLIIFYALNRSIKKKGFTDAVS